LKAAQKKLAGRKKVVKKQTFFKLKNSPDFSVATASVYCKSEGTTAKHYFVTET